MRLSALAIAALIPLAACSTVKEAVVGPTLAPVGYPSALVTQEQVYMASNQGQAASANSLWRSGARASAPRAKGRGAPRASSSSAGRSGRPAARPDPGVGPCAARRAARCSPGLPAPVW